LSRTFFRIRQIFFNNFGGFFPTVTDNPAEALRLNERAEFGLVVAYAAFRRSLYRLFYRDFFFDKSDRLRAIAKR
jgi:hypothetical protein